MGIDLVSEGGRTRLIGAAVALCGIGLVLVTLLEGSLNLHTLAPIALFQAAWSIIIAARMWNS